MKRISSAALVVGFVVIMIISGQAWAITEGIYERGCLIPYATYGDAGNTNVGIRMFMGSPDNNIYWTFLSADGERLNGGSITGAIHVFGHSFSLQDQDGNSHPNVVGYLIFTWDNNGILTPADTAPTTEQVIGANAVLLSTAAGSQDAVFLPVIPLARADYAGGVDHDLVNLNAASIVGLTHGIDTGTGAITRYWTDTTFGAVTRVVIWTSGSAPVNFDAGMSVDTGGDLTPVTLASTHTRLNYFNVATDVAGIPSGYIEGGLSFNTPGSDYVMFSLISSSVFSATQTLLAHERPLF
jgi:hypothetical protein